MRVEQQHGQARRSSKHTRLDQVRLGRRQGLMQVAKQSPFQSRLVKFGAHAVNVGLELIQFAALRPQRAMSLPPL